MPGLARHDNDNVNAIIFAVSNKAPDINRGRLRENPQAGGSSPDFSGFGNYRGTLPCFLNSVGMDLLASRLLKAAIMRARVSVGATTSSIEPVLAAM